MGNGQKMCRVVALTATGTAIFEIALNKTIGTALNCEPKLRGEAS